MRKIFVSCITLLILLAGCSFAFGPVELIVYGGSTASNYSGGYDLGASAAIDLPVIPKIGVEAERSYYAGNVNFTRLGLNYEQTILPYLASFKVAGGSSSIAYDLSYPGFATPVTVPTSVGGYYLSAGLIVKVINFVINPKYVYNQYGGVSVSESIINVGVTF